MKSLLHQRVMILGLGISGLAMARWCARFGAIVTVIDNRKNPPQLKQLSAELPTVKIACQEFDSQLIDIKDINLLLISPGIKPSSVQWLKLQARENNIHVGCELQLFSMALAELFESEKYKPSILAITGTNGKTTVTSLVGKLVACANKTVAVAGNIGPSLLETLIEKIDVSDLPEVWVLELSSFQLNESCDFEPTAGVVLNVTQDHLDWHGDMDSYAQAKSHVYGSHACMIINRDDGIVLQMLEKAQAVNKQRKYCTFGADLPTRLGDYGLETVNGMTWLVRAVNSEEIITKKQRSLIEPKIDLHMQRFLPAEGLHIQGQHNLLNALATLALVEEIGCSTSKVLYCLREYKGEPHRVESIGIHNGIEYFDDSKGTNVGATVAAISGLGKARKVVVILGGDGKDQDFTPLKDVVGQYVRSVILIGKDKLLIADALKTINVPKVSVETLDMAVNSAAELAQSGDVVLLSPACASFDMFDNYVHRGSEFKVAVNNFYSATSNKLGISTEVAVEYKP